MSNQVCHHPEPARFNPWCGHHEPLGTRRYDAPQGAPMSNIPYPSDFQINHDAARHEERRRIALRSIAPGDVISVVEDRLASEADPAQHPLYPVVLWLLDRAWTPGHGGDFWDQWKQLCLAAIDQLVDERLSQED